METKQAKNWDEYCDEVAKKYPNVYALTDEAITVAAHLNKIHAEAAELYNKETARERDELREGFDKLRLLEMEVSDERDRLKEENEKLKEDRENRIARELNLEEENERLKKENKKLNTCEERDEMGLDRVRKESFALQLSRREIISLKQLNSELVNSLENSIALITDLTGESETPFIINLQSLISKANQQKEKP